MILHSSGNSGEGWRSGSRLSFQEWRSKPCWRTGLMRKLPWLGLPLPPHPALEETAVTAVTTGEWLPPSNATHFCRVLHQQNARFQKKKKKLVSSPCSLLNKRFIGIHLIEEDQVPCLIPGCKGDWNGGPNSFPGEMGLKILELTKI